MSDRHITAEFLRSIPTTDEVAKIYFRLAADALDAKDVELRRARAAPNPRFRAGELSVRSRIATGMSAAAQNAARTLSEAGGRADG